MYTWRHRTILAVLASWTAVAPITLAGQPAATIAPTVLISAPLGALNSIDPLIDPYTFVFPPNQSRRLPITFRSLNFAGTLTLRADCCFSPSNRPLEQGISRVEFRPSQITLARNAKQIVDLEVGSDNFRGTGGQLVRLRAVNAAAGIQAELFLLVDLLRPPANLNPTSCTRSSPPAVEVLPMNTALRSLVTAKIAAPGRTSFSLGVRSTMSLNGWQITVERTAGVAPDEALVVFRNSTAWDKEIVPWNSASCAATTTLRYMLEDDESVALSITRSTSTLLLRREVCTRRVWACYSTGFVDVAVFDQAGFWWLFAGRKVTIEWIDSGGE